MCAREPDEAAWDEGARQHEVARWLIQEGRLAAAEVPARAALALLDGAVGPAHPDTATARATVAQLDQAQGRATAALLGWRQAAQDLEGARGDPAVRDTWTAVVEALSHALALAGDFAEAEARAAGLLADALADPAPQARASAWNLLGVIARLQGRLGQAEAAYQAAQACLGEDPLPPGLLHNLAGLACARGEHDRAEALARQAVAARRGQGRASLALAGDLAGLGDALAGQGRAAEAVTPYREALALFQDILPGDHPELAFLLHNLGDTLIDLGEDREAERLLRASVAMKTRVYSARHPEVAASLNSLAALLASQGRSRQACRASQRALRCTAELAPDHPIRLACVALAASLDAPQEQT